MLALAAVSTMERGRRFVSMALPKSKPWQVAIEHVFVDRVGIREVAATGAWQLWPSLERFGSRVACAPVSSCVLWLAGWCAPGWG